jgi:NDP-mannose synthase
MKNKVTALILAGGLGTRLRPLTFSIPKPMVALNGKPILIRLIEHLRYFDIVDLFLSTGYMSNIIEAYIDSGEALGVNARYLKEEKPLGTAGPLSLLNPDDVKDYVLLMNGDIYTTINVDDLINFHIQNKSDITIVTKNHEIESRYGSIKIKNNTVASIEEKPTYKSIISCGIYILNKDILKILKKSEFITMPELITQCISNNNKVSYYMFAGLWMPIEDANDLNEANSLLSEELL